MAAVGARARLDVAAALVAVGAGIAHGFPSCSRQGTIVAHIPAKEDKTERLNPNNARARPSKSPRRPPRKPVRTKESCTIRHARQNGLFRGFNRFACQAYASCSVKRTIVQKSLPRIMLTCLFCPPASYRKYHFLGYSRENEGLLPRPHRTQSPNATKPLSEARRMPARGIRNPHPRRAQALNNDEARLDSSRASQLPCGRRTVAVRRRCLVAGSLRGAGSARRGRGTRGAGSLRGAGSAGSARGARRARGAGMAGPAGSSAPHSGHTVSENWAFAPHFGHVLSISTAAGLKHMVDPFSFPTNTARAARPLQAPRRIAEDRRAAPEETRAQKLRACPALEIQVDRSG